VTDQTNNESQLAPGGDTTFISSTTGVRHSFLPGDVIDNSYQLTSLLGQGGMGVVFACRHVVLGKNYAMKLLKGDQLSGEYWSRFKAEAQALAQLNHPGIVGIHNMGVDGGQFPYYVMDLVPGEALDLLISKNGRVPVNEALDIFIQVADALGSAHLQGIIHRDVKPSNMMLVRDDKNGTLCVKIVDFGIARLSKHGFAAQSQTKTGMIFGTPFYMSPEQCQGLRVDQRSDIYSLGCTIFEALTGYTPFRGENSFHTFMLHQTEAPPSLKDLAPKGEFPEALEQALAKMLAKGPAERYQTMAQVKHDLERIRAGKSIKPQGVSTTIAPGQAQAVQESIQRYRQIEHENVEKQEVSDKLPTRSRAKISLIGGTAVIMSAAAGYIFFNHGTGSKSAESINAKIIINKTPNTKTLNTKTSGSIKADDLVAGTTGMPDLDSFMDPNLEEFSKNSDKLKPLLKAYRANPETAHSPFKQNVEPPGFQFPNGFLIGHIKIGDADPVMATGFVQAPPGKPVHMYLSNFTKDWPEILDKFGPADLTGLDIQAQDPEIIIQKIRYWTKLD
jgi:serine/threonine-protein kinase